MDYKQRTPKIEAKFFKMWKPWCYSLELRASDVEFGWSRTTVFAGEFYVTHQENFLVGGMQF